MKEQHGQVCAGRQRPQAALAGHIKEGFYHFCSVGEEVHQNVNVVVVLCHSHDSKKEKLVLALMLSRRAAKRASRSLVNS